jgi:hypothetical protein
MRVVSEDEAKKKVCPFSRNNEASQYRDARCLGSDCLAWEMVKNREYTNPADLVEKDIPYDTPHGRCTAI